VTENILVVVLGRRVLKRAGGKDVKVTQETLEGAMTLIYPPHEVW
jgi:hypothetical protein